MLTASSMWMEADTRCALTECALKVRPLIRSRRQLRARELAASSEGSASFANMPTDNLDTLSPIDIASRTVDSVCRVNACDFVRTRVNDGAFKGAKSIRHASSEGEFEGKSSPHRPYSHPHSHDLNPGENPRREKPR